MVLLDDNVLDDVEICSENSEESDEEEEGSIGKDQRHKKLLSDLSEKLGHGKKREFSSSRTEPSNDVSEYTWSSNKDKVSLQDLVSVLDSSCKSVTKVKKKLKKMQNKTEALDKPLEKVHRERVERSVAYEETTKDISKWNQTIQKNREAEHLVFPLGSYKPPPVSTKNMVIEFKPQGEMERQISEVLNNNKHLLERKDKELTEAEEKALQSVDLEEALERRKELQRMRALQSYYEVKRHRAKKIKSKKYHRMLKKEQQKSLSKIDLETLSKENPELFESEMEKAEQMRAKERASLRHRSTSKWAKNLITKGHKSKDDQERIREQLRISRQLTDHKNVDESDEETVENSLDENKSGIQLSLLTKKDDEDNPWLLDNEHSSPSDASKKCIKLQPITSITAQSEDDNDDIPDNVPVDEWEEAGKDSSNIKEIKLSKDEKDKVKKVTSIKSKTTKKINTIGEKKTPASTLKRICENAKLNDVEQSVKSCKATKLKQNQGKILEICEDDSTDNEEFSLDSTEQTMNISEAFANDDVVGDFIQEKNDIVEKSKPKAVDLTLPGWGEWGGPGLTISNRKRKKFIKDTGPAPKRRDDGNPNVIINEKCNESFAKHQVTSVPFPYTNKVEFERSIRQPIGGHWNTPSVHNKLIEPKVRIVPGVTIDPMKPTRRMKKKFKKELHAK